MRLLSCLCGLATCASSTILQNGQIRLTNFPDTTIPAIGPNSTEWYSYGPNATEISYKGRWDSKHISWWAAPGLKFGFTGCQVAITFGQYTSPDVLIAFRVSGLDWQFTNVTANTTHHLVSPSTPNLEATQPSQLPLTFELRVTNWAYGVQISNIHVSSSSILIALPCHSKTIEFIGDSLTAGMHTTYEALSGFGFATGAGLGNVEFTMTAYPGICLHDQPCWGNPRGQTYQWLQTSDTSPRAHEIWGLDPEPWNFTSHAPADMVVINLGTNDAHPINNIASAAYKASYLSLVNTVHAKYPDAHVVLMSLWNGFQTTGNTYRETGAFVEEIYQVYAEYAAEGWMHYFNSTGILQHNDISPLYHPTDVGQIKVASHLMQYLRIKFEWQFAATGPEVQHETVYWNDEQNY